MICDQDEKWPHDIWPRFWGTKCDHEKCDHDDKWPRTPLQKPKPLVCLGLNYITCVTKWPAFASGQPSGGQKSTRLLIGSDLGAIKERPGRSFTVKKSRLIHFWTSADLRGTWKWWKFHFRSSWCFIQTNFQIAFSFRCNTILLNVHFRLLFRFLF